MRFIRLALITLALFAATPLRASAQVTVPNIFTTREVISSSQMNANFAQLGSLALNRQSPTLQATLVGDSTNAYDLGSAAVLFRSAYVRTSLVLGQASGNYTVTWANPAAGRALTIPDPGGPDSFAFLAATQTFTNKTLTAPTLSGTLAGTFTVGSGATWNGAKIGLAYGGTNADLSATGGTHQFLRQASTGAAVDVVQPAVADLSDGSHVIVDTGSYASPAWISSLATSKLTGTVATANGGLAGNFSATAQGSLFYFSAAGTVSAMGPDTAGKFLRTAGAAANPSWSSDGSSLTSLNADNLASGSIPNARIAGTYSNPLTFSGADTFSSTLTISSAYMLLTSVGSVTLTSANQTINPGNASVVFVGNSDLSFSIQTISGGVEGRVLHVCSQSGNVKYIFTTGGNLLRASTDQDAGLCQSFVYHSSVWYYLN